MAVKQEIYENRFFPGTHGLVHPDDQLLNVLHYLQFRYTFDLSMTSGAVIYGLSISSKSPFRNNAVVIKPDLFAADPDTELGYVEHYFRYCEVKRNPSLYLREGNDLLEKKMEKRGWEKLTREAVMTTEDIMVDPSTLPGTVERVQNKKQLKTFIQILKKAHQGEAPHANPYGPISDEEAATIIDVFENPRKSGKVKHFIVYDKQDHEKDRKPVAVHHC